MAIERVNILQVADYRGALERSAKLLRDDGVIVLPTETVYGAAARLDRPEAMAKLKSLRQSNDGKPLTIHVADAGAARDYIDEPNAYASRLMRKLWPGPVGLVFDVSPARRVEVAKRLNVAEADVYADGVITLRCPDHFATTEVLRDAGGPVVLMALGGKTLDEIEKSNLPIEQIIDSGVSRASKPSTLLRVYKDRYEIARAGLYDERIIERLLQTTVLFVCSGNTCRSPMAEALARKALAARLRIAPDQLESIGYSVMSAGSYAMPGSRATDHAVTAVRENGGDLTRHRSQPLTIELIHRADAIYTMGQSHLSIVLGLVPAASTKASTLDPTGDIEDPIGGDQSLYTDLAGHLRDLIDRRLDEIAPADADAKGATK